MVSKLFLLPVFEAAQDFAANAWVRAAHILEAVAMLHTSCQSICPCRSAGCPHMLGTVNIQVNTPVARALQDTIGTQDPVLQLELVNKRGGRANGPLGPASVVTGELEPEVAIVRQKAQKPAQGIETLHQQENPGVIESVR